MRQTWYHTSPRAITKIERFGGCADACLFFSQSPYLMTKSSKAVLYSISVDMDAEIVDVRSLYDDDCISLIAGRFGVDRETAERLLDGRAYWTEIESCCGDEEAGWFIQAAQGAAAKKMGYLGVKDEDEQGPVLVIDMLGKEGLLELVTDNYIS